MSTLTKATCKLSSSYQNLCKCATATTISHPCNGRTTSTCSLRGALWDLHKPLGKDRWSLKDDFDGGRKPLSTMAYERKLKCEEELRVQTKGLLEVPLGHIVKRVAKPIRIIFNEL